MLKTHRVLKMNNNTRQLKVGDAFYLNAMYRVMHITSKNIILRVV